VDLSQHGTRPVVGRPHAGRQHARPQRVLRQAVDEHILACSQNGYLLGRGGCQHRWHSLVNCDHGDSTSSRFDSPPVGLSIFFLQRSLSSHFSSRPYLHRAAALLMTVLQS
jgi:hypothetical protein